MHSFFFIKWKDSQEVHQEMNFDPCLKFLTLLNAQSLAVDSKLPLRYLLGFPVCKKAGKAKYMLKTAPVD